MSMILDKINTPDDVKALSPHKLNMLCDEVRQELIKDISKTGGHLASNLGVIELTVALLKSFKLPEDKIVFDVGHQSYVYKMLTGRREEMKKVRTFGGISGFPKISESEYDAFDTGHAGTAVSVAYAYSVSNKLDKKDNYAVAVVGDASISNGLSLEALNNAGRSKTNLIVVLNDNNMSIGNSVGNINNYLTKIRTAPGYGLAKDKVKTAVNKIPVIGKDISHFLMNAKLNVKHAIIPTTIFDDLGFLYLGPVDGHDIKTLTSVIERAKSLKRPVLIHAITTKGKGYSFAEQNPDQYHGVSNFNLDKPINYSLNKSSYSYIAGKVVLNLALKHNDVTAICAAMADSTGLLPFKDKLPQRFFDVGISEGHAVTFAGGLSCSGKVPFVFIYSTFLQRAYDNIIHDVALENLHVVFMIDRAGITGHDGETHHGVFDISFLSHIPNMKIFTPYTKKELEKAVETAYFEKGPVAIRYPRGLAPCGEETTDIYKAKLLREGNSVTVVTASQMTGEVLKAEFDGDHIHLNSVLPLDIDEIVKSVQKTKRLIVVEDNVVKGGLFDIINRELTRREIYVKSESLGPDSFVTHGSVDELFKMLEIDSKSLEKRLGN